MKPIDPRMLARYDQPLPKALLRYLEETDGTDHCSPSTDHSSIAVPRFSLRRWWRKWMDFAPTDAEFRDAAAWLLRVSQGAFNLVSVGAVIMFLYLAIEIGSAFLPDGAVHRVLGGGR
jgi:hypothetical protein